jgi:cytosine/uracil/thiamine/allantoin permease
MLEYLLVGFIFAFFGFHKVYIKGMKELFNKDVTKASYYLSFLIAGVLYDFLKVIFR